MLRIVVSKGRLFEQYIYKLYALGLFVNVGDDVENRHNFQVFGNFISDGIAYNARVYNKCWTMLKMWSAYESSARGSNRIDRRTRNCLTRSSRSSRA